MPRMSSMSQEPDLCVNQLADDDLEEHIAYQFFKMESEDAQRRRKAAEVVATYIAEQKFIPAEYKVHPAQVLADAISDIKANSKVIMDCIRSLALMEKYAAPYAATAVASHLDNVDPEIRWQAASCLGYMGPDAAAATAEKLAEVVIQDHEPLVRYEVARTLQKMGAAAAESAAGALSKALKDKDIDVRNNAATALGAMGPGAAKFASDGLVDALLHGDFELRDRCCESLGHLGEAAAACAPALSSIFNPVIHEGSNPHLRRIAILALGELGLDAVRSQEYRLSCVMTDPDMAVRQMAIEQLSLAGCDNALEGAMCLFKYEDPDDETLIKEAAAADDGEDVPDVEGAPPNLQNMHRKDLVFVPPSSNTWGRPWYDDGDNGSQEDAESDAGLEGNEEGEETAGAAGTTEEVSKEADDVDVDSGDLDVDGNKSAKLDAVKLRDAKFDAEAEELKRRATVELGLADYSFAMNTTSEIDMKAMVDGLNVTARQKLWEALSDSEAPRPQIEAVEMGAARNAADAESKASVDIEAADAAEAVARTDGMGAARSATDAESKASAAIEAADAAEAVARTDGIEPVAGAQQLEPHTLSGGALLFVKTDSPQ